MTQFKGGEYNEKIYNSSAKLVIISRFSYEHLRLTE